MPGYSSVVFRSVGEVGQEMMILTICGRPLSFDQIRTIGPWDEVSMMV